MKKNAAQDFLELQNSLNYKNSQCQVLSSQQRKMGVVVF